MLKLIMKEIYFLSLIMIVIKRKEGEEKVGKGKIIIIINLILLKEEKNQKEIKKIL